MYIFKSLMSIKFYYFCVAHNTKNFALKIDMLTGYIIDYVQFDGVGVGRRSMASVVAENPRNRFVFLDLLQFSLQSFQDNHFIPVCMLASVHICCFL
jgi:hypothetical protein